jgi:steroid 5-alpha reductase family enzyme
MVSILITGLTLILGYMSILWLASLALKDSSIVDIFWGAGFVVAGTAYFFLTDGFILRKILILSLVAVWGIRLSIHIYLRNRGRGEDFRYQAWRRDNGKNWWWISYFKVFLLQGILLWIISAPLLAAQFYKDDSYNFLDYAGILFWLIGFLFEAVGDYQLAKFRQDTSNKGKVLRTGLWQFTRHPNYFGDAAVWWGFYLIAVAAGGWWSIFAPAIMTGLLVKVSGVALLEKNLKDKKPEYRDYIEKTSAFIPWFPKK